MAIGIGEISKELGAKSKSCETAKLVPNGVGGFGFEKGDFKQELQKLDTLLSTSVHLPHFNNLVSVVFSKSGKQQTLRYTRHTAKKFPRRKTHTAQY